MSAHCVGPSTKFLGVNEAASIQMYATLTIHVGPDIVLF